MSKFLTRTFAFLLAPCLVAGPRFASADICQLGISRPVIERFEQEAFASVSTHFQHPSLSVAPVLEAGKEAGILREVRQRVFPFLERMRQINAKDQLSESEKTGLMQWLQEDPLVIQQPSDDLFRRLFWVTSALVERTDAGGKKILSAWVQALGLRWGVRPSTVRSLFKWFDQSLDLSNASITSLREFIDVYLDQHHTLHSIKTQFNYVVQPGHPDDLKLAHAKENMERAAQILSVNVRSGKSALKAPIGNTPYFLGMRFGMGSSSFGIEILLGKNLGVRHPLGGVFFRLGVDTAGTTLRNVRIGGVRQQEETIKKFWDQMGMSPAEALFLVELEFAKRHGFKEIVGVAPEFLSNAQLIQMPYRQIYKQLGLTRSHPLGLRKDLSQLEYRMATRVASLAAARTFGLMREAFIQLQEIARFDRDFSDTPMLSVSARVADRRTLPSA